MIPGEQEETITAKLDNDQVYSLNMSTQQKGRKQYFDMH